MNFFGIGKKNREEEIVDIICDFIDSADISNSSQIRSIDRINTIKFNRSGTNEFFVIEFSCDGSFHYFGSDFWNKDPHISKAMARKIFKRSIKQRLIAEIERKQTVFLDANI